MRQPPYSITLCDRPLSVHKGRRHHLVAHLTELGHQVTQTDDAALDLDPASVLWLHGNPTWFPTILRRLRRCPATQRPFTLVWFNEPLPQPRAAGLPRPRLHAKEIAKILLRDYRATDVYSNARRLDSMARRGLIDLLVVSSEGRRQFLAERGIAAHVVPLSFGSSVDGAVLDLERDLDVLFLGAMVPRRRRLLRSLRRRGVEVTALGSWYDPSLWGDDRSRLLGRTRIFLNLQRYPGELAGARFILGMAAKCLVVSEPVFAPEPFEPGRHFVSCDAREMHEVIRHYLEREDERASIAEAGYRLATTELTTRRAMERVLKLVDEGLRTRRTA